MPETIVVLCVGRAVTAIERLSLAMHPRFHCIVVPTTKAAAQCIQGPENVGAVVISDIDDVQDHISFVSAIKPYFSGPIVVVGHDIGFDRALKSVGCTHRVQEWADVPAIVTEQMGARRSAETN